MLPTQFLPLLRCKSSSISNLYSTPKKGCFFVFFEDNALLWPTKEAEATFIPLWRPLEVFAKPQAWIIFLKKPGTILYLVKQQTKSQSLIILGFAALLLNIDN